MTPLCLVLAVLLRREEIVVVGAEMVWSAGTEMETFVVALGEDGNLSPLLPQKKGYSMDTTAIEATRSLIYEALHEVYDPELGVNVVDLGLVYNVDVSEHGHVTITMTFTTPGCPLHEAIGEGVGVALQDVPGITSGEIRLVWDPPWKPSCMTEEGRRLLGF
jgi:metal-sulfur cluster biosynthetic enzyme